MIFGFSHNKGKHEVYTKEETNSLLGNKSNASHNHNSQYYTKAQTDSLLGNKSNTSHNHDTRYYTKTEIDNRKELLTARLREDYAVASSEQIIIPFLNKTSKLGSNLTIRTDGGVQIGEGIKYIRFSGQVYFYVGETVAEKIIDVDINDATHIRHQQTLSTEYQHIVLGEKILEVSEGDVIYVRYKGNAGDIIKNYIHGTFISIDKIS